MHPLYITETKITIFKTIIILYNHKIEEMIIVNSQQEDISISK
jgi:hypothetical protein